jgi:hypothetical protein
MGYVECNWIIVLERGADGVMFFGTYEEAVALYPYAYSIERER